MMRKNKKHKIKESFVSTAPALYCDFNNGTSGTSRQRGASDFYVGQWVRYIDKEYNGHFHSEYVRDRKGELIREQYGYRSVIKYGKNESSWYKQPDLNYGELCQVVLPQGTPTGIVVQKQNGETVCSLWQWFIDDKEWDNS